MTINGVCKISILAQRQQIFTAPLFFSWMIIIHQILSITISSITILLVGCIINVYQQFNGHTEDIQDGFYDHCRLNGLHPFLYALGKSFSSFVVTLLPMMVLLIFLGSNYADSILICFQWLVLSTCISYALCFSMTVQPLNSLLAWIPLFTAPILFLADFLNEMNKNSLLIFFGCDIILVSAIFIPFIFSKNRSVKNVFSGS